MTSISAARLVGGLLAALVLGCGWLSPDAAKAQQYVVPCTPPSASVLQPCVPTGLGSPGSGNSGYPPGATPLLTNNTNANTSSQAVNLFAPAGKIAYVCGFIITGLGATSATPVSPTLLVPGQIVITYDGAFTYAAGAAVADAPFQQTYSPCLAAATVAGTIVLTIPGAAGNTTFSATMWGYTQ